MMSNIPSVFRFDGADVKRHNRKRNVFAPGSDRDVSDRN